MHSPVIDCLCGDVFTTTEDMALHLWMAHGHEVPPAPPRDALDVERETIDNCIYYVQQSLDTLRGEDDGESRVIKTSIAAREHVIRLLEGYRSRVVAQSKEPTPPRVEKERCRDCGFLTGHGDGCMERYAAAQSEETP